MDVKFYFHHKMMELYIHTKVPRNCEKSGKLHILQLHHPAYCDLSSARRSPITLDSFPKDDESNFDLGLSQPCKVDSGENLPLLFVQAQFSTPIFQ